MLVTKDTTRIALIDGDIIAYRAAAVTEGDGPDELVTVIRRTIRDWAEAAQCTRSIVFMSEGRNFRHDVYEPYKQNRKGTPKPSGVDYAKEYMLDKYEQVLSDPELEADDRMGLYATENRCDTEEMRVIVSTDKDMLAIPCWVYNPDKSLFPTLTGHREAELNRYQQWVCGDSVDGYPGIKGVGIKKWEKYLQDNEQVWTEDIIEWFIEAGYDREFALSQLLCATIKHNHLPEAHKARSVKDLEAVC